MGNLKANKSIAIVKWMKYRVNESVFNKLDFFLIERVINALSNYTYECETCNHHLGELEEYLLDLEFQRKTGKLRSMDYRQHKQKIRNIISHLKKEHDLKSSARSFNIFVPIGTAIGIILGFYLSQSIILAIIGGIFTGITVGYVYDTDYQKNDLTL
ncbi:hypothetical protein [Aquibacillus albus]|uniref:Ribosomal protein L29 n=1 Tax=Aquibacillus albus TaxID=1168171 RepID=A0ABS2N3L3_9BACI|nr:hypothetical protein [Aquibacillus albus]MBM7572728.1 ribosomal protein L29 [Aquibacillus albus]